jgi:hypothetical protein
MILPEPTEVFDDATAESEAGQTIMNASEGSSSPSPSVSGSPLSGLRTRSHSTVSDIPAWSAPSVDAPHHFSSAFLDGSHQFRLEGRLFKVRIFRLLPSYL